MVAAVLSGSKSSSPTQSSNNLRRKSSCISNSARLQVPCCPAPCSFDPPSINGPVPTPPIPVATGWGRWEAAKVRPGKAFPLSGLCRDLSSSRNSGGEISVKPVGPVGAPRGLAAGYAAPFAWPMGGPLYPIWSR